MIAVDHVGVAHPGDAALGADVGGDPLERHHRDGAGVLGDLRLLGGDDVHDHAALQHLGHAALDAGGAGAGSLVELSRGLLNHGSSVRRPVAAPYSGTAGRSRSQPRSPAGVPSGSGTRPCRQLAAASTHSVTSSRIGQVEQRAEPGHHQDRTSRSARSAMPPLASKPSDSACARA